MALFQNDFTAVSKSVQAAAILTIAGLVLSRQTCELSREKNKDVTVNTKLQLLQGSAVEWFLKACCIFLGNQTWVRGLTEHVCRSICKRGELRVASHTHFTGIPENTARVHLT